MISDIDKITLFRETFRDIGTISYNEFAGYDWRKDLEYYVDKKGDV